MSNEVRSTAVSVRKDKNTGKWLVYTIKYDPNPALKTKEINVTSVKIDEFESFDLAHEGFKLAVEQDIMDPIVNGIYKGN